MTRVTKGLCLYKNSDPKGLSASAPGLYTCIPCENKTQLCVKAAEKPAFLRILKKAAEKLRIFLDLLKTCIFYKTAAEKLRLFL